MGRERPVPPEPVVIEAAHGEPFEPGARVGDEGRVVQESADGEDAAVGLERRLGELLGLSADEFGRGPEEVALDRVGRIGLLEEAARLGQRGVVAEQGVGDDQVQRYVLAAAPVPLGGPVAAPVRRGEVGLVEILGRSRLVVVGRVSGIHLSEPDQDDRGDPRERGVFTFGVLLVVAYGCVKGGLGEELARLVVALGREVEPLVGVALTLGLDFMIGVMVDHAGEDFHNVLGVGLRLFVALLRLFVLYALFLDGVVAAYPFLLLFLPIWGRTTSGSFSLGTVRRSARQVSDLGLHRPTRRAGHRLRRRRRRGSGRSGGRPGWGRGRRRLLARARAAPSRRGWPRTGLPRRRAGRTGRTGRRRAQEAAGGAGPRGGPQAAASRQRRRVVPAPATGAIVGGLRPIHQPVGHEASDYARAASGAVS